MKFFTRLLVSIVMLWATTAQAIISIEITKGLGRGFPIAIVPFSGEEQLQHVDMVSVVIDDDLSRSGRFETIPRQGFLSRPQRGEEIVYKDWRLLKAEAVAVGRVQRLPDGRFFVEMELHDVFKQGRLVKVNYTVERKMLRSVAHQMADIIYEKLTGEPGAFNTRIAYVSKAGQGRRPVYKLEIADSDGFNARAIVSSREPLMSPAWSPDGRRLAYVSFEERRSIIYVQDLADGKRFKIAESKGINSAPAWSPDGSRLAVVLSREGNPDIYSYNFSDRSFQRLTNHSSIDTEPAWSPDGREIMFTSDRSGRPQIYRMSANGSDVRRITFEGTYNARASYSPDGRTLTLINVERGGYRTSILNLQDSSLQVLTDTQLDESPTFAPNGRMILYATRLQGRGVLATVSSDGQVRQLLKSSEGDIREPAWSPVFLK